MKKLFPIILVVTAILGGCESKTEKTVCEGDPSLPCASHMTTEGQVTTPKAAKEFCARHPEFEQC